VIFRRCPPLYRYPNNFPSCEKSSAPSECHHNTHQVFQRSQRPVSCKARSSPYLSRWSSDFLLEEDRIPHNGCELPGAFNYSYQPRVLHRRVDSIWLNVTPTCSPTPKQQSPVLRLSRFPRTHTCRHMHMFQIHEAEKGKLQIFICQLRTFFPPSPLP